MDNFRDFLKESKEWDTSALGSEDPSNIKSGDVINFPGGGKLEIVSSTGKAQAPNITGIALKNWSEPTYTSDGKKLKNQKIKKGVKYKITATGLVEV